MLFRRVATSLHVERFITRSAGTRTSSVPLLRRRSVSVWTGQDLTVLATSLSQTGFQSRRKPWRGFRREAVRQFTTLLTSGETDSGGQGDRAGINLPEGATDQQWREVIELRRRLAGKQRELAAAAVVWAKKNYPGSIASYIAEDFAMVASLVGDIAAADIGDYFLGDLANLCVEPTVENIVKIVKGETIKWLNTPGAAGWFGSMMDALGRLGVYVERVGLKELGFTTSFNSEGAKEYHHPDHPNLTLTLKNV